MELEQARITEAIATSADRIPVLVDRLRATETRRRDLAALLETASSTAPAPAWKDVEGPLRKSLKDWRSLLAGDVARAREGFRQLLTMPVRFTPFVDKRGFRGVRFEGRWSLEAVFGGLVTQVASPMFASWNQIGAWLNRLDALRRAA